MKAAFTCDDVFDVLTREPFPSGGLDDGVVESHLAVCHECRQLAEAFRPAVGLFHESLSAGFDDELPMYRGRLRPIIDSPPRSSPFAPRKDVCSRSEQRHSLLCRSLAIAASLIMVGSAIIAAWAANQRTSGIVPAAVNIRIHGNRDDTLLAALEIPTACRSVTSAPNLAAAADITCCTKCHSSASRIASTEKAILKSAAACIACHDGMLNEALSGIAPRWLIEFDRVGTIFRDRFEVINVRLMTECSVGYVHARRGSSNRPRWLTEALAQCGRRSVDEAARSGDRPQRTLLDAYISATRPADAVSQTGQWAWRTDSGPAEPKSSPMVTCKAERLC